jgi:hypothetical protein
MAKITITIDSETDELDVDIDGKKINDVEAISVYLRPQYDSSDDKELCVNIQTCLDDEESGVKTYTTLMAADTSEAKELRARGVKLSKAHKSFLILKDFDKVRYDLLEHFGSL